MGLHFAELFTRDIMFFRLYLRSPGVVDEGIFGTCRFHEMEEVARCLMKSFGGQEKFVFRLRAVDTCTSRVHIVRELGGEKSAQHIEVLAKGQGETALIAKKAALIQFCYLLLQHPFHEVVHMQSANVVPPLEVEHCGQGVIQLKHGLHWKTPDLQEGSADHHSPAEDSFQGEPTTMANNEKE